MIGSKVYVADGASSQVREGTVSGTLVNCEGYELVTVKVQSIKDPEKPVFVGAFKHMVFDTYEEASEKLDEVIEVNARVKAIREQAEKEIDAILDAFHGEAPYKHLIDKGERD